MYSSLCCYPRPRRYGLGSNGLLEQPESAEKLFAEAVRRPGFLLPKHVSRFHLFDAQYMQFIAAERDDPTAVAAIVTRARQTVDGLIAEAELPKDYVVAACLYALRMKLWDQAEFLNARWRHLAPDEPDAQAAHAHLLSRRGHHRAAETIVRGVLERFPDHWNATLILQKACQGIY